MPKAKSLKVARRFRKTLLTTETKSEKEFEKRLIQAGVEYKKQHIVFVSWWRFFIVDFYLPKHNLVVEIDGHIHLTQKKKDKWRTELLLTKVGKLKRIKNENVCKVNLNVLLS